MHREMLASTVQFSRDNQALKPHQHPPNTTNPVRQQRRPRRRQHTPQHPRHHTRTSDRYGYQGQAPTRHQTSHHHPQPAVLPHDQLQTAAAAPGPSGPNSVPDTPPLRTEPVPHPTTPTRRVTPSHRGRGAVLEPATQTTTAMLMFHPRAPPSTRTAEKVGHTPHPKATTIRRR